MKLSLVQNLPVTSPRELCEEIANFVKKEEDSFSLPKLELLLQTGTSIRGKIINLQEKGSKHYVWIENNMDLSEKISILLLDVSQIIGINILDFESYQTSAELAKPIVIIGDLELKRKKKSTEEQFEKFLNKPLTINVDSNNLKEEARAVIYKNLSLITTAFQEILTDEMSKSIISQSVRAIDIKVSDCLEVTLNEGTLSILVQNKSLETASNQIVLLKEKIERVF